MKQFAGPKQMGIPITLAFSTATTYAAQSQQSTPSLPVKAKCSRRKSTHAKSMEALLRGVPAPVGIASHQPA